MYRGTKLIFILLLLGVTASEGQNLLSPKWQLSMVQEGQNIVHPVNLLLSWERQGFSQSSPAGILSKSFSLPKGQEDVSYVLELKLMLDIESIYINQHKIGGDIPADFIWSRKPKYKSSFFKIPPVFLHYGGENKIDIKVSNYAYTGGKSHNKILLYPEKERPASSLNFSFAQKDHLFTEAKKVSVLVTTQANKAGVLELTLRNDLQELIKTKEIKVNKGKATHSVSFEHDGLAPGFYQLTGILHDKGYTGATSFFTLSPTSICHTHTTPPDDYDIFWREAMQELNKVEPQYSIRKVDSLCTQNRNGYLVEMQSMGHKTIGCYYFVPKEKGKYPALINFPGYGYGFEELDEFLEVKDNIIELAVCVRGHGISRKALEPAQPVPGFLGYKLCDKEQSAYRMIYMDCIRALQFILTREEVDQSKIGVLGGSQGGGLAIMTAGLMPQHVKALAYSNPFPVDMKNARRVRRLIENEIQNYLNFYNNACSLETVYSNFEYIDAQYFSNKITCPTCYITGLEDDDCPSRLGFAAYTQIKASKEFKVFPNDSHIGESDWKKEMMLFFKKQFGF